MLTFHLPRAHPQVWKPIFTTLWNSVIRRRHACGIWCSAVELLAMMAMGAASMSP